MSLVVQQPVFLYVIYSVRQWGHQKELSVRPQPSETHSSKSSLVRMWSKLEFSSVAGGVRSGTTTWKNNVAEKSNKAKHRHILFPRSSLLGAHMVAM